MGKERRKRREAKGRGAQFSKRSSDVRIMRNDGDFDWPDGKEVGPEVWGTRYGLGTVIDTVLRNPYSVTIQSYESSMIQYGGLRTEYGLLHTPFTSMTRYLSTMYNQNSRSTPDRIRNTGTHETVRMMLYGEEYSVMLHLRIISDSVWFRTYR